MPNFRLNIANGQMIADVFILEQGQTIPVKALFDTGATGGCICKSFWL